MKAYFIDEGSWIRHALIIDGSNYYQLWGYEAADMWGPGIVWPEIEEFDHIIKKNDMFYLLSKDGMVANHQMIDCLAESLDPDFPKEEIAIEKFLTCKHEEIRELVKEKLTQK